MRKYLRKKGNRVTAPPPRLEQLLEHTQPDKEKDKKESKEQPDAAEAKAAAAGTSAAEGKEDKEDKTAGGGGAEDEKDKKKKKKKKGKGGKDEPAAAAKEKVEDKPVELAKQDIGAAIAALQLQAKKAKQKS